jgi:hypothetical protein
MQRDLTGDPQAPKGTLDIESTLQLEIDGETADIRGEGDVLVIDVPSRRMARSFLSGLPPAGRKRKTVRQMDDLLQAIGMTLDVRVEGSTVAKAGRRAKPGGLTRLLGLPVEVPADVVLGELKQRPRALVGFAFGVAVLIGLGLGARR